ncbi:MAG: cyclodeaminase/cyclohydrolase family protein [Thermoleophilia bacterium]
MAPRPPCGEQGPLGQDRYIDESIRSFLAKLGGRSTEPAGGAALALAAASAAALISLACHSGIRAHTGAEGDESSELLESRQHDAEELARHVGHLVDADVLAYRDVSAALRMAHGTDEERARRTERLDAALRRAIDVPLEVAEAGLNVLALALEVHGVVPGPVVGDLAAAVHLAEAAVDGSLRNAHINASALSDRAVAAAVEDRIAAYRTQLDDRTRHAKIALGQRGVAG